MNKNVDKDLIYHTAHCEVVRDRFNQMHVIDLTNRYFKKEEIKHKYEVCKLCRTIEIEVEKRKFQLEEEESQRQILEDYQRQNEQDI